MSVPHPRSEPEPYEASSLAGLVEHMRRVDTARVELESNGGTVGDLNHLTQLLARPVNLGSMRVALTAPARVRQAIALACGPDVHLQVRRLSTGLPAWLLVRTRYDWWSGFALVVEDLYRSGRYPLPDPRFASLLTQSREVPHLRLSPFRPAVEARVKAGPGHRSHVDAALHRVGQLVLSNAWHSDQRPCVLLAEALHMPSFRNAVELLYLVLSGDLCMLRGAADDSLSLFFAEIYPQQYVHRLLTLLPSLSGADLAALPVRARAAYAGLTAAAARFLQIEVPWGAAEAKVPIGTLLLANYSRFLELAPTLLELEIVQDGARRLGREAEEAVDRLLGAG